MKCQLCGENEANVQVKQVVDGEMREITVCQDCAAKNGLNIESPIPMLTDFLFGLGEKGEQKPPEEDRACPECHMHYSDFRKASLLGCPACYDAFGGELTDLFETIQEDDHHTGKIPEGEKAAAEAPRLEAELARAVADQNFERAAELRDALKALTEVEHAG